MGDLLDRHRAVMGLETTLFYEQPLHITRGEGVWLYDADGNRYLDCYNNVPCVGHANPHVVEAITTQAATLNAHGRYLHDGVVAYAERLTGLFADGLDSVVFTCSGTEANQVALAVARTVTGNTGVIVTDGAYHGNIGDIGRMSRLAVHADPNGLRAITTPDRFRPPEPGLTEAEHATWHLAELRTRVESLMEEGAGLAALMVCPILANEGLPVPPANLMPRAMEVVRAAGGLVIVDEVQAGFGRTGSWWGHQTTGITPDLVTLGKPMGNGMPVAAVVGSHDHISDFRRRHRYFNTNASSPVQAAAGNAVIDEIENRELVDQAERVGSAMAAELRNNDDPRIGEVRSHGLFIGLDWVHAGTIDPDPQGAAETVEALKARRVLIGTDGKHDNVLKIRPPLAFEEEHAELFLESFESVTT